MNIYLINKDAHYSGSLKYDYYIDRDCFEAGCDDEGICRCGKITDEKVSDIKRSVLDHLVQKIKLRKNGKIKDYHLVVKDNTFFEYCVNRLYSINKLYEPDSWEITISGGYYGQEIDSVSPTNSFFDDVVQLAKLNPQERINYVLTREYGYVHEKLRNKVFIERTVPTKYLVIGNEYRKIYQKIYDDKEYKLPIGIYLRKNNKFVLIDGYNRFYSIVPNIMGNVTIISGE
jgi:hypothetical protein